MITILAACDATNLTAAQTLALSERAEWVIVNKRLGRVLIDLIGERKNLQWIIDKLAEHGLNPVLIAAFRADTGQRIKAVPINLTEWLTVAPNLPNGARPTVFAQTHGWLGWAGQVDVSEP